MKEPLWLRPVTRAVADAITIWSIRLGIPRPPYTRDNALIIETIGRRSGKRRRIPVGYIQDDTGLLVVAEDGARAGWVRNALEREGRLRVHLRGRWRAARLRLLDGDPEDYLRRMNKLHASLVRIHSTAPQAVEIRVE